MKLVVVCERCERGIVIHKGEPVTVPFGMQLAELIVAALENHRCIEAKTGQAII